MMPSTTRPAGSHSGDSLNANLANSSEPSLIWNIDPHTNTKIDRRSCSRIVPMQVLALGLPRMASLSTSIALTTLGFPCYHMREVLKNPMDADMWLEALAQKEKAQGSYLQSCRAAYARDPDDHKHKPEHSDSRDEMMTEYGRAEFDKLLGHCSAITDVPAILFWRELLRAYPDVKVILVQRNKEKWLASFRGLIAGLTFIPQIILPYTDPVRSGRIFKLATAQLGYLCGVKGYFTVEKGMAGASKVYEEHFRAIRAAVPKERLLEYKVEDGWEPLCEFLGKEVPDMAFPRVNDADTIKLAFAANGLRAVKDSLWNIGVVIGVACLIGIVVRQWS